MIGWLLTGAALVVAVLSLPAWLGVQAERAARRLRRHRR